MTEAEWEKCAEPWRMFQFLEDHFLPVYERASEREQQEPGFDLDDDPEVKAVVRKLRLFSVACCRHIGRLLTDARSWQGLEWVERFVDGLTPEKDREAMARAAGKVTYDVEDNYALLKAAEAAYHAVDDIQDEFTDAREVADLAVQAVQAEADPDGDGGVKLYRKLKRTEEEIQARLLRDVFTPFRTPAVDPAWLRWKRKTIPKLAATIYDERAFDRLPVLADALEEAGCTDAAILAHCRGPDPHARGCWAIDLLLGKA
jgi:hypothetical protein